MGKVKNIPLVSKRKVSFKSYMKRYWQLYILLLIPVAYLIIFKYIPMLYVQIAFKKYSIVQNIWEMPWAKNNGFEYFIKAFNNKGFINSLRNTILLNLLDLVAGFPAPIIFALIINELVFKRFKKFVQTVAYMPHFLSWIIISSLTVQLFATDGGMVNQIIKSISGGEGIPFLEDPIKWVGMYIGTGVWQNFGWGSIVYLAAIAGINPELYEAASVDGAGRFKKMWHITLPGIRPTIVVLLIINLGNILGSGFDRPWAMRNNAVLKVAEVISTFVYLNGVRSGQFSMATAVGLFQSVVCLIFLFASNTISRKLGERGIW